VNLLGVQHVHHRKERSDGDFRERLFERFTRRGLLQRLAVLQEARGNGPVAAARLDRAAAQQDAAVMLGDAPHHDSWIQIMDRAARLAHVTGQGIAVGDAQPDRSAALVTELHDARARIRATPGACRR